MNWLYLLVTALVLIPRLAANSIHGTVYVRDGESMRGLSRAVVSARSATHSRVVAVARSGPNGAFHLEDLPAERVVLTASRSGHDTRLAAGLNSTEVHLDCSGGCAYFGIDFELVRGAVVAGQLIDTVGEPVEGAQVDLIPQAAGDSQQPTRAVQRDSTDDRGMFRLAGLKEGRYLLSASTNRGGRTEAALGREIRLREGEELTGITLTLSKESTTAFRLSGSVEGFDSRSLPHLTLKLRGSSPTSATLSSQVAADGSFDVRAVPAGRYRVSGIVAPSELDAGRREYHLGWVNVEADHSGLLLRPLATGIVRGSVHVESGRMPSWINILFTSLEGFGVRSTRVTTADSDFQLEGLLPGSYRIAVHTSNLYLKNVRLGGRDVAAAHFPVSSSEIRLEIILAGDHGRVFGRLRTPGTGQPLPLGRVILRRGVELRSQQADQNGTFLFEKVVPGEYQICAWADISPEAIGQEATWEDAGCRAKIIPVAPESDVEIDLTATL